MNELVVFAVVIFLGLTLYQNLFLYIKLCMIEERLKGLD